MGDNFDEELQQREDALAEEQAVEDFAGGTDSSYYDDDAAYNYDDSSELTDVDYNPYDQSAEFTGGGTGAEAYNPVSREDESGEEDDEADYGVGQSRSRTESFTDDYDDEDEDFDGKIDGELGENEDGEEDEEVEGDEDEADGADKEEKKDNKNDGQPQGVNDNRQNAQNKASAGTNSAKDYQGYITWPRGSAITLELLAKAWPEFRKFQRLHKETDNINKIVKETIEKMGPNLMLRLNNYIDKTSKGSGDDMVGSLLRLISSKGKWLTFTAIATVEAIFDQQWMQAFNMATLRSFFQTLIKTPPVSTYLNRLFIHGVPLVNRKYRLFKR